jgi:hypothetical protein
VEFDGTGISVFELKRDIIIKSGLGDGTDFDLAIFNEDGKEGEPQFKRFSNMLLTTMQNMMMIPRSFPAQQLSSPADYQLPRRVMAEPPDI